MTARDHFPWLGLLFGVLAAVGYSLANICLRMVADLDPVWVSFLKAIPTVAIFGPLAIWQAYTGKTPLPRLSSLLVLIVAAVFSQLLGNALLQWSFGVVGVALSVPLSLGMMLVFGVVISRWMLQESLTRWQGWGTAALVLALVVLSLAGRPAVQAVSGSQVTSWLVLGGILAPILSGISYAFLSVAIRRGVSREVSVYVTISLICAVGMVVLGPLSLLTATWPGMMATTVAQYAILLVAGLLNAGAFIALALAFRCAPVIIGNAANSLQNPLTAVAGVVLFQEAFSLNLAVGVVLTVVGVVFMGLRDRTDPQETGPAAVALPTAGAVEINDH